MKIKKIFNILLITIILYANVQVSSTLSNITLKTTCNFSCDNCLDTEF